MHAEARDWVARHATAEPVSVLDIGGRNVNGSVCDLFPNAEWTALDILPGDGVDIVADAVEWEPYRQFDVVVSTEVFEHAREWRRIVATAYAALKPGGRLIATMAGPGRAVHSGVDGGSNLREGEHYQNIEPEELRDALVAVGFVEIEVERRDSPGDVRAVAYR